MMLTSCKYCGGLHERGVVCEKKPKPKNYDKKVTIAVIFRNTHAWKEKRNEIKARDRHLCQACIRNMVGTKLIYNFQELEVHHIRSIQDSYQRRLDPYNLITLCKAHHKVAELGGISRKDLWKIAKEQEDNYTL